MLFRQMVATTDELAPTAVPLLATSMQLSVHEQAQAWQCSTRVGLPRALKHSNSHIILSWLCPPVRDTQVLQNGSSTMIVPEAGPAAKVLGAPLRGCKSTLWKWIPS